MFRGFVSGAAVIGLAVATVLSGMGTAMAAPRVRDVSEDAISSPQAMVLRGTHGYEVTVRADQPFRHRPAEVVIDARGVRGFVQYTAPASLAGEGIHASLGQFGRIDMRWVPDGRVSEIRFGCHGRGPRRQVIFDRGAYVGTLRFRGGNGFTTVGAHHVEWRRSWYRGEDTCPREAGETVPGPGKILRADVGLRDPSVWFLAYQAKPGARVEYEAFDRERVGHVEVERTIWADGGPRSLTSTSDFASATIEPPTPFTGTATFERTEGGHGTWIGDLAVDFPDGSVAAMAGGHFAATFYSGSFEEETR